MCVVDEDTEYKLVGAQIEIIGFQISGWLCCDRRIFPRRKPSVKLLGDGARDLALNRESIGQSSVVNFRPHMRILARVNQLRAYTHFVAGALHAAFENVSDTEGLRDLTNIA